jgi:hypothetical protein
MTGAGLRINHLQLDQITIFERWGLLIISVVFFLSSSSARKDRCVDVISPGEIVRLSWLLYPWANRGFSRNNLFFESLTLMNILQKFFPLPLNTNIWLYLKGPQSLLESLTLTQDSQNHYRLHRSSGQLTSYNLYYRYLP